MLMCLVDVVTYTNCPLIVIVCSSLLTFSVFIDKLFAVDDDAAIQENYFPLSTWMHMFCQHILMFSFENMKWIRDRDRTMCSPLLFILERWLNLSGGYCFAIKWKYPQH